MKRSRTLRRRERILAAMRRDVVAFERRIFLAPESPPVGRPPWLAAALGLAVVLMSLVLAVLCLTVAR